MDCREVRERLWPPRRPRLVGDGVAEARLHVERCRECAEYFEQDRVLLDLYDRVRRHSAPPRVRERVVGALSEASWATAVGAESASRPTRFARMRVSAWPIAICASLAIVVLADLRPASRSRGDDPTIFVEDYLRRAVGQDYIDTDDPEEVRRFLQRELGMLIQPLRLAGLNVRRVEICLLDGRRGAMIVYERDGAEVSHYLVPREGTGRRAPTLSNDSRRTMGGDLPVVTWSTPQLEQALVGEVTSQQLLEMARVGSS